MDTRLAIDIGGTKTRIAVFSESGILEEWETAGVGLAVESDGDLPQYREALSEISKKYNISSIAVNLGGRNAMQVQTVTKSVFPAALCRVVRESEGDAALAFGKCVGADAILLAGTGTILVAKKAKDKCIFGGWGMNIGDGGSGYDIGLCAIRKTLLSLDGTAPLTPLEQEISGLCAPIAPIEDAVAICMIRDEVRTRLHHTDRRAVASLVKTVADHAARGEADALSLFTEAGKKMGDLVLCGARKLNFKDSFTVAVTGGLLNTLAYWQSEFENTIKKETGATRFVYEKDGLLRGIMALAEELDDEK